MYMTKPLKLRWCSRTF